MQALETELKGCYVLEPDLFIDNRGYFFESFNKKIFENITGVVVNFVQDNESRSKKSVLRGLHYQKGQYAQAKLVRVIKGSVLDVAVDLRKNSDTFGKHFSVVLSEENKKQLFVPRGFAHGFLTLEDNTIFSYKCDNYYNKALEGGIIYNDPQLNIDWGSNDKNYIITDKDKQLPYFKDILI